MLFTAIGYSKFEKMECDGTRPKTVFTSVETDESSDACLGDIVLTYEGEAISLRRGSSENNLYVVEP